MTAIKELTERTRFMRNAAPREYDQFVVAFANYTRSVVDELVTTNEMSVVQGRAQQCVKILRLLEEIK